MAFVVSSSHKPTLPEERTSETICFPFRQIYLTHKVYAYIHSQLEQFLQRIMGETARVSDVFGCCFAPRNPRGNFINHICACSLLGFITACSLIIKTVLRIKFET